MRITLSRAVNHPAPRHRPSRWLPALLAATFLLALAAPLSGGAQSYPRGDDEGSYAVERGPSERRPGGQGDYPHAVVRCESTDQHYRHCRANTNDGVQLHRQLSKNACRYQETWGYDRRGIWVDRGCRGDFQLYTGRSGGDGSQRDKDNTAAIVGGVAALGVAGALLAEKNPNERQPPWIVRCESDGGYNRCRADTRDGVRLYRQLSRSDCRYNGTWGYDRRGVWVDNGCRAEFAPR